MTNTTGRESTHGQAPFAVQDGVSGKPQHTPIQRGNDAQNANKRVVFTRFWDVLLDKPSVGKDFCAVCGRPAHNLHHAIQKGMGGVTPEIERCIPKVALCGDGNASGCHGLVHQGYLHLYWAESLGGWVWYRSRIPCDHESAWRVHRREYRPLRGWMEQKVRSIGGRG